jgi:hypothetical protein
MDKTVAALVKELQKLSTEVSSDKDLQNVAAVSAGGDEDVGQLIADAMAKVGGGGLGEAAGGVVGWLRGWCLLAGGLQPCILPSSYHMLLPMFGVW